MPELTMDDVLANTEAEGTEIGALETFSKGLKTLLDNALANEPISPAGTRRVDKLFAAIADQKDAIAAALSASTAQAGTVATSVAVTSSLNPATVGTPVTFTAAVTVPAPAAPIAGPGPTPAPASAPTAKPLTGKVKFMDGAESIGTGTVDASSKATMTKTFDLAGTYSITAVYSGDAVNAGSTSPVLTQTVS
jgi:hypothetical protein